jgi:hypothetical protein
VGEKAERATSGERALRRLGVALSPPGCWVNDEPSTTPRETTWLIRSSPRHSTPHETTGLNATVILRLRATLDRVFSPATSARPPTEHSLFPSATSAVARQLAVDLWRFHTGQCSAQKLGLQS